VSIRYERPYQKDAPKRTRRTVARSWPFFFAVVRLADALDVGCASLLLVLFTETIAMRRWEGFRDAADGARLFCRRWMPDGEAKAAVGLLHGVCEHTGRYDRVAEPLTGAGYVVCAFDLRGHGRSSGARGDTRLEPTMRDVDALLDDARSQVSSRKVFLFGQSLGGLLALAYVLDRKPDVRGVVASAPVLHTALSKQRLKVAIARTIGRVAPSLGMRPGLSEAKLMRDEAVLADRRRDPLVHDRVTAGTARDVLDAAARVLREAHRFPAPLLLIHGRADEVNLLSGSEEMAAKVPGDATLRVYDGVKHHPHNDPDRTAIFEHVVAWLDGHLGD
jgi:acylglycerol lipase